MSAVLEHMQAAMAAGWEVLPLPEGEKAAPPAGSTGRGKRFLEEEEVFSLASEQANYGLSLQRGVIGLEFDLYNDGTLIDQLKKSFGVLPVTASVSSNQIHFK